MLALSEDKVRQLTANSPALDKIALRVRSDIAVDDRSGKEPTFGVRFEPIDGTMNFRATVHHVDLVIQYEQEVEQFDKERVLFGVFRARLDEPVKADRELISSFRFDSRGETTSTGDFIGELGEGEIRERTIKSAVALVLAHDVQRYIAVKSRKATVSPLQF